MVLGQFFCRFTGSAAQLEHTAACARRHGPQFVSKKFLEEEIFAGTNFRELVFDRENRENFPLYGIFINVHCIALSNLPWALAQARQIWVSTCIKDALEWFDYLCASSTLSCSQTVRQCV